MGSSSPAPAFGKPMREEFLFDKDYINLNHGSFGTYPHTVRSQLRHFQDLAEGAPDKYMRYSYASLLLEARQAVAQVVNVHPDTCVFVQNATLGINTVLRNIVYKPGDVIVYFDTIYGACEKTIESILERDSNVQSRKVEGYQFPCEHDEIVQNFVRVVEDLKTKGLKPKVAIFDTICAMPGVRFPFEKLTEECKNRDILSCIDAAHGIGHIPLDLTQLDPDFFVTNCHKWLFTPRGCALFYVPTRNQDLIRTSFPTSHGFIPLSNSSNPNSSQIRNPLPAKRKQNPTSSTKPTFPSSIPPGSAFTNLFDFIATTDNAPYYCIPTALSFRASKCGGESAITTHLSRLARSGGDITAQILGTEVMDTPSHALRDCAFANVRLPLSLSVSTIETAQAGQAAADVEAEVEAADVGIIVDFIQRRILEKFNTFIAVYVYKEKFWARLSAQVYLEEGDFRFAGEVLRRACAWVRDGEWREEGEGGGDKEGQGD